MLSRDADNCFWIGRYVERAEAISRLLDVRYHASLEAGKGGKGWDVLRSAVGEVPPEHASDERGAFHWLAFADENPDAIVPLWTRARDNARTIREQLSSEMWESLNVSWLELRGWDADRVIRSSPDAFLARVRNASHLFQGILNRTLAYGEVRDWLDSGRFLERACQTARHLLVFADDAATHSSTPAEGDILDKEPLPDLRRWTVALRAVSGLEMHRKMHPAGMDERSVVAFLLLERRFPASLIHAVARTEGCLYRISGRRPGAPGCDSERLCGRLVADLTFTEAATILDMGLSGYLNDIVGRLEGIGEAITRDYLVY